ncbi:MAG: CBS domain-containing protein [Candidatus Aenigmatarchaeota archaeon]
MLVSEIMSNEIDEVSPSDPVSIFISMMEKEHVHEAAVIENKKLVGMVRFDGLLKKGVTDPTKQKIGNVMEPVPATLIPENTVEEAVDLLWKSGMRSLPVCEGKKVIGTLSVWHILEVAAQTKPFRQTRAESVMSVAEVISKDADIGAARVRMREHGFSRLPVVDDSGKLVGIVAVNDLLKAFRTPREKMTWYGMAAEMERMTSLPVSNIMNDRPPTASKNDSLSDVVRRLVEMKSSGITITENGVPVGVITVKDLLDVYAAGMVLKGMYYQTIGLEGEDETVMETVHRMIGDSIQKISAIVPVQFAVIHFKRHDFGGMKVKWSVRARFRTARGTIMSKAWAWDSRDATGHAMDNIERELLKKRGTVRDKSRENARKLKEMLKTGSG